MIKLTVIEMSNGSGIVLPAEVLQALQLKSGDSLYLAEMLDGSYRLSPHDEQTMEQIEFIEGSMHEEDA